MCRGSCCSRNHQVCIGSRSHLLLLRSVFCTLDFSILEEPDCLEPHLRASLFGDPFLIHFIGNQHRVVQKPLRLQEFHIIPHLLHQVVVAILDLQKLSLLRVLEHRLKVKIFEVGAPCDFTLGLSSKGASLQVESAPEHVFIFQLHSVLHEGKVYSVQPLDLHCEYTKDFGDERGWVVLKMLNVVRQDV